MTLHQRVRAAIVPLVYAIFSTGIAAVILIELAGQLASVPTHVQIMIFAVPAVYWVLSALTFFDVVSKDGAVVISLIMIPIFIVLELFIMGFAIPLGIDGIG